MRLRPDQPLFLQLPGGGRQPYDRRRNHGRPRPQRRIRAHRPHDSKVGQQCLYARIRTLRGQEDAEAFGRSTDCFSRNGELAASCTESLSRLTDEDAYGLQNLIFDTPAKVRYFAWVYPLTLLAVATLLAAPFYPLSLLLFMAVFAVNLYIHYSNNSMSRSTARP